MSLADIICIKKQSNLGKYNLGKKYLKLEEIIFTNVFTKVNKKKVENFNDETEQLNDNLGGVYSLEWLQI